MRKLLLLLVLSTAFIVSASNASNYDGGLTGGGGGILYCVNANGLGVVGQDGTFTYKCQRERHYASNAYWTVSGWKWGCPDQRDPCYHWHWLGY